MIIVSATKLRNNLFEFLARVSQGESITVQRNGENIAVVTPAKKENWRDKMTVKARLLVPPDEAFEPMKDVWEDYL